MFVCMCLYVCVHVFVCLCLCAYPGHYMYFEASGTPVDTRAILESPQIAGGTACTFTMWYHMYGSTTGLGTLYVYQYTPSASSLTQIWSKSGNQVRSFFFHPGIGVPLGPGGGRIRDEIFRVEKSGISFRFCVSDCRVVYHDELAGLI